VKSDELDVIFDHAGGVREHGVLVEVTEVGGALCDAGNGEGCFVGLFRVQRPPRQILVVRRTLDVWLASTGADISRLTASLHLVRRS
jgi:hypothetical protein